MKSPKITEIINDEKMCNGNGVESAHTTQNVEKLDCRNRFKTLFLSGKSLKTYCGIVVLFLLSSSWVSATHFLKETFQNSTSANGPIINQRPSCSFTEQDEISPESRQEFSAPFLTCWFCMVWTILFFPLYSVSSLLYSCFKKKTVRPLLSEALSKFNEAGLSKVLTNYLYIASLKYLDCTVVTAIFATNASFVYLLSWVILHQQFVGIRIMAFILTTTGISLLAYMDGVVPTTLSAVLIASASAVGSAIYKVIFKKLMGCVTFAQVSLFFSIIGLINTVLLWPIVILLYAFGVESWQFESLPWLQLSGAALLSLGANLLANYSIVITYENFITFGLVLSVPVSAAYDSSYNGTSFTGMKLAGLINICCGFVLVLTPSNWADILKDFIRVFQKVEPESLSSTSKRHHCQGGPEDGIHRIQAEKSVRQSEMNETPPVSALK